jgi:hypothetical protein
MSAPASFNQWLFEQHGIASWVVGRMTRAALERYPRATFLTRGRYEYLCEEHRTALREETLLELASKHHIYNYAALRDAFEAGRVACR